MFKYGNSGQYKFNINKKEKNRLQHVLDRRILCQDKSRVCAVTTKLFP